MSTITFSTFQTQVQEEVQDKNSLTLTLIRRYTVSVLKEISSNRTLAFEASTTFNTSAGVTGYNNSVTSAFPADLLEVTRLYYKVGSTNYDIPGPASMDDVRFRFANEAATATYPSVWGWSAGKLELAPAPSGTLTLYLDYLKDGTRDSATGNEITTSTGTYTNEWFGRGERALRYAVMEQLFASPTHMDLQRAAACRELKDEALRVLSKEFRLRKEVGGQADPWLGRPLGAVVTNEHWPFWNA